MAGSTVGERRIEDAYAIDSVGNTTDECGEINDDDDDDDDGNAVGPHLVTFDAAMKANDPPLPVASLDTLKPLGHMATA